MSLSAKDRSALCLLGGQKPDACYWFDTRTGTFVTSTAYRDRPHPWVEAFNAGRPADRFLANDWTHFRPNTDYVPWSGPDDVKNEGSPNDANSRVFPQFAEGRLKGKDSYYGQRLHLTVRQ